MQKIQKNKKWWILSLSTLGSVISLTSIVSVVASCKNDQATAINSNLKLKKFEIQNETQSDEWELFLKNTPISLMLKDIFPNEKERLAFIKQQKAIDNGYLTELRDAYAYANPLNNENDSKGFNPFNEYTPYMAKRQRNLATYGPFTNNWLWFLFNISNFVYVLNPEKSDDPTVLIKQSLSDLISDNTLNEKFYRAKNNQFVELVKIINNNDLASTKESVIDPISKKEIPITITEVEYYLLNKDGYWMRISTTQALDEQGKQHGLRSITLYERLTTLPKLKSFKKQLLKKFSLAKYMDAKRGSESGTKLIAKYSELHINNLNDFYGGEPIDYLVVEILDSKVNKNNA
ncbi:aromatic motif membrane protein [Ureaplasma zalophigenitalium]|uniref:Aromatic cluster surface protein n=1 Tax=Ureaplasma zalophigenitalium TaxID=907723 RepID=A0ABT3BP15_9BACT|nr:aromatic motif membrane protein [Ureaplasma zalophigenitalium]MCV3753961.1 hypothetical protein [Ureaplasma zalophigenitalium]